MLAVMIAGLALWFLAHTSKTLTKGLRAKVVAQAGEGAAKGVVALLTVAALAMIVLGYQGAAFTNVWTPPSWTMHLNNLLMLIAVAVFIAGDFKSYIRHLIRHPQLTGTKIWAVAHLLVNGDLASVILFGGILGWAVFAMILINKRDGKGEKPGPGTMKGNIFHAVATVVAFAVVIGIHTWAGVSPLPG